MATFRGGFLWLRGGGLWAMVWLWLTKKEKGMDMFSSIKYMGIADWLKVAVIVMGVALIIAVASKLEKREEVPITERGQTVHEVRCDNERFLVYAPDNSIGFKFLESGEKISNMPNCLVVKIGRSNKVGGKVIKQ